MCMDFLVIKKKQTVINDHTMMILAALSNPWQLDKLEKIHSQIKKKVLKRLY